MVASSEGSLAVAAETRASRLPGRGIASWVGESDRVKSQVTARVGRGGESREFYKANYVLKRTGETIFGGVHFSEGGNE